MRNEELQYLLDSTKLQNLPKKKRNDARVDIQIYLYYWLPIYWKHEDETKCITVEFNTETNAFVGINTFGIRMRHEIFNKWLTENRDIDYVMNHLADANFDPEEDHNHAVGRPDRL